MDGNELFKISRFKEVIKKTSPHKHGDYYELIFLNGGEGFHWIEAENYQISAPEIYFLKPGQLHCWQFTAIPKGFVVLFKEEFFDPIKEMHLIELIRRMDTTTHVVLPGYYQPSFLFEEIFREYQQPTEYSINMIHGYLRAIFSKVLQLSNVGAKPNSHYGSLHEQFLEFLSKKCPELHTVSEFASMLHTSPQNLNASCRKYTAKSASEHIAAQLLTEAKRHILHTDKTITEIAHLLHFNDASYFVKFFKKQAGVTPLKFRESHFQ